MAISITAQQRYSYDHGNGNLNALETPYVDGNIYSIDAGYTSFSGVKIKRSTRFTCYTDEPLSSVTLRIRYESYDNTNSSKSLGMFVRTSLDDDLMRGYTHGGDTKLRFGYDCVDGGSYTTGTSRWAGGTVTTNIPAGTFYLYILPYNDYTNTTYSNFYALESTSYHPVISGTIGAYTVTFNANGGSGLTTSSMSVMAGSTFTFPASPTKPKSGSSSSSNFVITGNANGGVSNTSVTAIKTTTTSYSFGGWSTSPSATSGYTAGATSPVVNGNVTYYATWKSSTSTSYSNNTVGKLPNPKKNRAITSTATITINPNYSGGNNTTLISKGFSNYTFKGWATSVANANAGTVISSSTSFTSATTLYASWIANFEGYDSVKLPLITRSNYSLLGYTTNSTGTSVTNNANSSFIPTSTSTTFYALWNPINYLRGSLFVGNTRITIYVGPGVRTVPYITN